MPRLLGVIALQLAGIAAVTVGLWWVAPWLGMVWAGVLTILLGLALERRLPTKTEEVGTDVRAPVST